MAELTYRDAVAAGIAQEMMRDERLPLALEPCDPAWHLRGMTRAFAVASRRASERNSSRKPFFSISDSAPAATMRSACSLME